MPQVPIIMPQLGESIAEATIVDIKVKPGDEVADDQEIIDVETNKAVMGVTTPCKGKIDKITVQLKETYPVGAVLGYVEASEARRCAIRKTRAASAAARKSRRKFLRAPIRKSLRRERKRSPHATATATRAGGSACSSNHERRDFHVAACARAHGRIAVNNC